MLRAMGSARDQGSVRGARASMMTAPIALGATTLFLLACSSTTTTPVEDAGGPMDSAGSIGGAGGMAGGGGGLSNESGEAGTTDADRNDGSLQTFPFFAVISV